MRWKLLVIASLAAVLAGAGLGTLLLYLLTGRAVVSAGDAGWPALVALVLPLAAITYASVFVYRRTARRRKLQAALTALVSLTLTLAVYFGLAVYTTCCAPPLEQTPPAPRNVSRPAAVRPRHRGPRDYWVALRRRLNRFRAAQAGARR